MSWSQGDLGGGSSGSPGFGEDGTWIEPNLSDVPALRALLEHDNLDVIAIQSPEFRIYQYDVTEASADDGDAYVKPTDVGGNGRWVRLPAGGVAGMHALGSATHTSDTLANLNTKISDATLDDSSASRTPSGAASGDLSGTYPSPTVGALQGDNLPATATHQFIKRDSGDSAWEGVSYGAAANTVAEGSDGRFPSSDEKLALVGTDGTPDGTNKYVTNSDSRLSDARTPSTHNLSGAEHSSSTLANLNLKISDATLDDSSASRTPSGSASGDLSGTYPSPTVGALQGDSLPATAAHQFVKRDSGDSAWEGVGYGSISNTVAEGSDGRFPTSNEKLALAGTSGTVGSGNKYVTDVDSRMSNSRPPNGSAGGQLSGTYPNPSVAGITTGVTPLAIGTLTDGEFLKRDGSDIVTGVPTATGSAGGDLSGTYPNPTAAGLQGDSLAATTANGFIKRNSGNTAWESVGYGNSTNTVAAGDDGRFLTTDAKESLIDTSCTGYFSGGVITKVGGLDVSVASGQGFVTDETEALLDDTITNVVWSTVNPLTLTADSNNFIYVNSSGTVAAATSSPDLARNIVLGNAYTDATEIVFLSDHKVDLVQRCAGNHEYIRSVVGPISVSGGAATINATNNDRIDVDSAVYYILDEKKSVGATAPISYTLWYKDGSGGYKFAKAQTTANFTNYDDSSGTLASLTASYFRKDLLFITANNGTPEYHIVLGQEEFTTQLGAENGNIPVIPDVLRDFSLRIASVVAQQGASAITSLLDERPKLGQLASQSSSVSDHGNLSGLDDDDHTIYLLASGTRSMIGNLNMGTNNITNIGTLNGVTVETHGGRHINGGSDVIDGDKLEISYVPTNYTRTTSPTEVDAVDQLTAHLAAIDNYIGTGGKITENSSSDNETSTAITSDDVTVKDKLTHLTTASLSDSSTYAIHWNARMRSSNTAKVIGVRLFNTDESIVLGNSDFEVTEVDNYENHSGFAFYSPAASGTKTFKIQYYRITTGQSVTIDISDARILIQEI